jgi:carbohydrate-selective porin OprB
MSSDIRQAQREANALAPGTFAISDYEAVIELSYKLQMTAWWTVQASLQRVFHPGGSSANPNATVFILQTTLRF